MSNTREVVDFFNTRRNVDIDDLQREIKEYEDAAVETRACFDSYAEKLYGITDASTKMEEWADMLDPSIDRDAPKVCLARQVATWSTEQLAFYALGKQLKNACGIDYHVMPFVHDSYGRHPYKESLIKVPELMFDTSSNSILKTKNVELMGKAARRQIFVGSPPILHAMDIDPGKYWGTTFAQPYNLVQFHADMVEQATGQPPRTAPDIQLLHNRLFAECLSSNAKDKPSTIFLEENGLAVKRPASCWEMLTSEERVRVRPPADWYYFFYLSLFITGKRILCASLDDDKDVHAMFAVMMDIKNVTGRMPLIIPIPYKYQCKNGGATLYFNEVNPNFLCDTAWYDLCAQKPKSGPLYERMLGLEMTVSLYDY